MANLVVKNEFLPPQKQILLADELAFTMGAIITNTGISADGQGKKIIKAGTPLAGDLLNRQKGFKKATTTPGLEEAPGTSDATAVLLHDVDVTLGNANGTIVIFGFIDKDKLDTTVQALYDAETITALSKITLVQGNDQLNSEE